MSKGSNPFANISLARWLLRPNWWGLWNLQCFGFRRILSVRLRPLFTPGTSPACIRRSVGHSEASLVSYFFGETTASRQAFATRNLTIVFFGIRICSPVRGLCPLRAFRCAFTSFPIPGMDELARPLRLLRREIGNRLEPCRGLLFRRTCIVSDIWATIWVLVMGFFAIPQVSSVLKLT